jgi:hypothetical protein
MPLVPGGDAGREARLEGGMELDEAPGLGFESRDGGSE